MELYTHNQFYDAGPEREGVTDDAEGMTFDTEGTTFGRTVGSEFEYAHPRCR